MKLWEEEGEDEEEEGEDEEEEGEDEEEMRVKGGATAGRGMPRLQSGHMVTGYRRISRLQYHIVLCNRLHSNNMQWYLSRL